MPRTTLVALSLLLAGSLTIPASASQESKRPSETKIRISKKQPRFHGRVASPDRSCMRDRKVRVFLNKNVEDRVIGRARTDREGKWLWPTNRSVGLYYAKVNRTRTPAGVTRCAPALSESVFIR